MDTYDDTTAAYVDSGWPGWAGWIVFLVWFAAVAFLLSPKSNTGQPLPRRAPAASLHLFLSFCLSFLHSASILVLPACSGFDSFFLPDQSDPLSSRGGRDLPLESSVWWWKDWILIPSRADLSQPQFVAVNISAPSARLRAEFDRSTHRYCLVQLLTGFNWSCFLPSISVLLQNKGGVKLRGWSWKVRDSSSPVSSVAMATYAGG
jgi:hypothetical protein